MQNRSARLVIIPVAILVAMFSTGPLSADDPKPPSQQQLDELQQKLDTLLKQADEIRQQLEQLRAATGQPAQPQPTQPESASDELLNVAPVNAPQPPPPAAPAAAEAPAVTETQLVQNAPNPGASKVFNPDMSVIGNFLGHAGDRSPIDDRPTMSLDEAEVGLEAFVDPYAKAKFFLSATKDGVDVEEGFINFITLPADFTAKVGKMKATFGKINTLHPHVWPWVDQPLVVHEFFGEEGLNDSGISVSRIFSNPWNLYIEGTAEAFRGDVGDVVQARNPNDLLYVGHLKVFHDISDNSNFELGGSFARGTLPDVGGSNEFAGADLTWRWKPLEKSLYRSFISRTEIISNKRADQTDRALGFYTSADYQFAQRWFAGLRLDQTDRPEAPSMTDRGGALTLTFWPSEFSQLRGELRHLNLENEKSTNELLLQIQFSIGAHGAHTF